MRVARVVAVSALVFLGVTAMVGAIPMLLHPGGEPWQMPQTLLARSSFHSYLVPGIILLLAIGLMSFWVAWLAVRRRGGYGCWVIAQGCVLAGWLVVQMVMLRMVILPHYFYGAVAVVLVVTGGVMVRGGKGVG